MKDGVVGGKKREERKGEGDSHDGGFERGEGEAAVVSVVEHGL